MKLPTISFNLTEDTMSLKQGHYTASITTVTQQPDCLDKVVMYITSYQSKESIDYIKHDISITTEFINRLNATQRYFDIENVIFNGPATIVFWADGTKTVVKTQTGETFDPEKGLSMAITKRALGNQGNYYNTIKEWVDKYNNEEVDELTFTANLDVSKALTDLTKKVKDSFELHFTVKKDD